MKVIFTICSNNYLAQATALGQSISKHDPNWHFIIGLVDIKNANVPYDEINAEILEVAAIEPLINHLAIKYSIIELNTVVKPGFFQYFFKERQAEKVIYLDPDTYLYASLSEAETLLDSNDFLLTPHILSPVPDDGLTPDEPLFLNYGLFNLGFLGLRSTTQTEQFLNWWKERIYAKGYNRPAQGLFVDQLWINLVPLYFDKISVLRHLGYNMAPWNLHERKLKKVKDRWMLDDSQSLVFYHFSSIVPGPDRLHKEFSRFSWNQRPDLWEIYNDYKAVLNDNNFKSLSPIPCYYVQMRSAHLKTITNQQTALQNKLAASDPWLKKFARRLKKLLPGSLKRIAHDLIKA